MIIFNSYLCGTHGKMPVVIGLISLFTKSAIMKAMLVSIEAENKMTPIERKKTVMSQSLCIDNCFYINI